MTADDTIAALSTASGQGAIAIVRLSGPRAIEIADAIFSASLRAAPSHTIHHGFIVEGDERIDEVLVSIMRAPRTYTRQDVVEVNCHGGMTPTGRVLELMLKNGARMAGPGEFTRRAFLSGRIDLVQAEATLDMIAARTSAAERLAIEQLSGRLSERIREMRDILMRICAHIEAHIDFPDDEIEPQAMADISGGITDLSASIKALSATCAEGRLYREGVKIAIVGRPNVGKSSLLNAMLERDRAIVTPMPGTTRDVIEEQLSIRGLPVRIIDTAGVREATDIAEQEGVRRSIAALDESDLALAVIDATAPDDETIKMVGNRPHIVVTNKIDLAASRIEGVKVSALTGEGIEALRDAIHAKCTSAQGASDEGVMVTNMRHREALDQAAARLDAAHETLGAKAPLELVAIDAREALDALGRIIGATTTDDILDIIFNEFCIGK